MPKKDTIMAARKFIDLCVGMTRYMQESEIKKGEVRMGTLEVVEPNEEYVFRETPRQTVARNPQVYKGEVLNVTLDKHGKYKVHTHEIVLSTRLNASRLSSLIYNDLMSAKEALGL